MQLSWWCDELQDWTLEQAVWGLRKWNREHPRSRPTPGDIVGILKAERGRQKAAEVADLTARPDTPREPASPEAVAEILARAGYAPRGFGAAGGEA